MKECLNYDVDMSWSEPKVGPGEPSILKIKGTADALCSVGKNSNLNFYNNIF